MLLTAAKGRFPKDRWTPYGRSSDIASLWRERTKGCGRAFRGIPPRPGASHLLLEAYERIFWM